MLKMQLDSLKEQLNNPWISDADREKLQDRFDEALSRHGEFAFGKSYSSRSKVVGGDNKAVPRFINTEEDDDMTQISALTQPLSNNKKAVPRNINMKDDMTQVSALTQPASKH